VLCFCDEGTNLQMREYIGAEFVVPFSSRSEVVIKNKMTTLFVQNDKVFTQIMMFSLKPFFLTKTIVIFNDNLRARERE
jgi:hypothetical protein